MNIQHTMDMSHSTINPSITSTINRKQLKTKRILVIDSSADVRMSLMLRLQQVGYSADVTGSGMEAIKRIKSPRRPNLIILDPKLSDIDGLAVATSAKQNGDIPIIFLSETLAPEMKATMIASYNADCMSKPFAHHELLARIQRILFPYHYKPLTSTYLTV